MQGQSPSFGMVDAFYSIASTNKLPVAIDGSLSAVAISNSQGTFLAKSVNPRARALAAIMACHDAHEARTWPRT